MTGWIIAIALFVVVGGGMAALLLLMGNTLAAADDRKAEAMRREYERRRLNNPLTRTAGESPPEPPPEPAPAAPDLQPPPLPAGGGARAALPADERPARAGVPVALVLLCDDSLGGDVKLTQADVQDAARRAFGARLPIHRGDPASDPPPAHDRGYILIRDGKPATVVLDGRVMLVSSHDAAHFDDPVAVADTIEDRAVATRVRDHAGWRSVTALNVDRPAEPPAEAVRLLGELCPDAATALHEAALRQVTPLDPEARDKLRRGYLPTQDEPVVHEELRPDEPEIVEEDDEEPITKAGAADGSAFEDEAALAARARWGEFKQAVAAGESMRVRVPLESAGVVRPVWLRVIDFEPMARWIDGELTSDPGLEGWAAGERVQLDLGDDLERLLDWRAEGSSTT